MAGASLGFCQWLVFERRLDAPLRWWGATALGTAVGGALIEWGPARGDALYATVVVAGLLTGGLQWLALRRMTAGTAQQGGRS